VIVRLAEVVEAESLSALVERSYGLYVERIGRRPAPMDDDYLLRAQERSVFVAEDGEILGLIVLIPKVDHLFVENVAVDPQWQGRGIGRALLGYAEDYARERELFELRLYTNEAMTENLSFYPRLGYQEYGRQSEHGFRRVYYRKVLASLLDGA
jgi:ribosomal protein S18 acetylase RimI-like enzyme